MKSEPRFRLRYAALALLAALAACGDANRQTSQATAGGEVLEASVSDAMLPVDRVSSQPPLAPKGDGADQSGKSGKRPASGGDEAGPAADDSDAGDEPAAAAPSGGDAGDSGAQPTPDAE